MWSDSSHGIQEYYVHEDLSAIAFYLRHVTRKGSNRAQTNIPTHQTQTPGLYQDAIRLRLME